MVLVHAVGAESFEAPPRDNVALLCLNTCLDSLYSLLLFGILVPTPLIMSVGCMLVMPASTVTFPCCSGCSHVQNLEKMYYKPCFITWYVRWTSQSLLPRTHSHTLTRMHALP